MFKLIYSNKLLTFREEMEKSQEKIKVLILCTGNSCRSQMAHGYFNHFGGSRVQVYSAGVETHGVNPWAIKAMAADGIDISQHTSNNVTEYEATQFDFALTVCDHAKEVCPIALNAEKTIHHTFKDPYGAKGTDEEILAVFAKTRDEIKEYVKGVVESWK